METLITLSYIAFCVVVFRIFKVPKNKWTITTAAVGGCFLVGWIFLYMAMYQPVSRMARIYSVTTPITSEVSGLITDVFVKGNEPLKKGSPLYQIDTTPFEAKVEEIKANIKKVNATISFANSELQRYIKLKRTDFASKEQVDNITAQLKEDNAEKLILQSQLKTAEFNLESTTVRAPTDGYVTQIGLRPGMKSRTTPFQGNLSFVHAESKQIFAAFKQTPARYIKVGYLAEVTFNTVPGHAFKAKVVQVNDIFAQGAFLPSGHLNYVEQIPEGGRILVKVVLDNPEYMEEFPLPSGTDAHVAVYSPDWEMFSIVRKVILRMQSWKNWVYEG